MIYGCSDPLKLSFTFTERRLGRRMNQHVHLEFVLLDLDWESYSSAYMATIDVSRYLSSTVERIKNEERGKIFILTLYYIQKLNNTRLEGKRQCTRAFSVLRMERGGGGIYRRFALRQIIMDFT